MTKIDFIYQFDRLVEMFSPRNMTEGKVEMYFKIFEKYETNDFTYAVSEIIETKEFFPKPAELKRIIDSRRREVVDRVKTVNYDEDKCLQCGGELDGFNRYYCSGCESKRKADYEQFLAKKN